MKHPSAYLDWYIHVPNVKHDFRSSGLGYFKYDLALGEVDLSINYANGNPEATRLLAQRYHVKSENVFISSEGASGQNVRLLRYLAEKTKKKEAVIEYPTYEPFLRQVQEFFPKVKRLERGESDAYRLDSSALRKLVSNKTGLLVLTNPHAPSGAISNAEELREIMAVAHENGIYVLCDEIYAEFERNAIPTVFSVDEEIGIVTTSFTKAYGLGGLRFSAALAKEDIVKGLYNDTLNTIGNSSNIVQLITIELLDKGREKLERHKQKWTNLKNETEKWLNEKGLKHFSSRAGITYWIKTPIKDTYKWINDHAIPNHSLAPVPGAFFLFRNGYKLVRTDKIRLGLGNINPENPDLAQALETLGKAVGTHKPAC
jgi:aspartate/methionine/tyrosine aminotransferase